MAELIATLAVDSHLTSYLVLENLLFYPATVIDVFLFMKR